MHNSVSLPSSLHYTSAPNFVEGGLDDGVEVPAVSSKNFESLREDIMGWGCREVKVFSGTCNSKTVAKGTDCFI